MKVLIIEPFYGGSHKAMIDTIVANMSAEDYFLITMSAKKWHWRARCSSLYISQLIPDLSSFDTLFCSSVLNLSELIGLCPSISKLKKITYFHENQLTYPVQCVKKRDFQYGYNQITTCLASDIVLFNSEYNKSSFLDNINKFMKIMPDYRLKNLVELISPKCRVLYFPIDFTGIDYAARCKSENSNGHFDNKCLHIVWPHRWEFDKNPDLFFDVLYQLQGENIQFKVSILGEIFTEIPSKFIEAQEKLSNNISSFGYVKNKEQFYKILLDADVVVSTADHEFFGVSMIESVRAGCLPLAPNKLVYRELYPRECLYDSKDELYQKLNEWSKNISIVYELKTKLHFDTERFNARSLIPIYMKILKTNEISE